MAIADFGGSNAGVSLAIGAAVGEKKIRRALTLCWG
jgi:hypothetical protein